MHVSNHLMYSSFPRPYTSGDAEEAARFLQPAVHIETSMSDHAVQEGKDELGSLRFSNRLVWSR